MYREDYDKTIERMKYAVDLAKDYSNMKRCEDNLRCYDRANAWVCLQDMLREYAVQINIYGKLFDGKYVIWGVVPESKSDDDIRTDLSYIARHIPAYVLIKEGEKELAKGICEWLDGCYYN